MRDKSAVASGQIRSERRSRKSGGGTGQNGISRRDLVEGPEYLFFGFDLLKDAFLNPDYFSKSIRQIHLSDDFVL